jgi:hypothetical protein
VTESLDPVERPNLQLALDHLVGDQEGSRVIGLPAEVRHYPEFSIGSVLSGGFRGPAEPTTPSFDALPIDVDETLPCVIVGVDLVASERGMPGMSAAADRCP